MAFNFGDQKVRGVNIGGWLVLEPWITPSIFESQNKSLGIVDEFSLTQKLGTNKTLSILQPHWDTWCTFADFKKIANAGFNTVRIPIGYWAYTRVANDSYTQGAAKYIDAAVDWARATNLKIWIDLHGAPGSQNGFDNSGQLRSSPGWQQGDTVAQTLHVLNNITQKYAQPHYQDVVVAVELLNEPMGPKLDLDNLRQFYQDGYDQVRSVSDTPVILHDAFGSPSSWNGFLTGGSAQDVIIDHHEYQVFTNDLVALQPWEHINLVCSASGAWSGSDKLEVIGEWTGAMTDCAKYLNGYGVGARYDGTFPQSTFVGSCVGKSNIASWDQNMKDNTRRYLEAQMDTFEQVVGGWVFWNFKTEGSGEWDAFKLLDAGIFPQPLGARKFAPACSFG